MNNGGMSPRVAARYDRLQQHVPAGFREVRVLMPACYHPQDACVGTCLFGNSYVIDCPTCGVKKGQTCVGSRGRKLKNQHAARIVQARVVNWKA